MRLWEVPTAKTARSFAHGAWVSGTVRPMNVVFGNQFGKNRVLIRVRYLRENASVNVVHRAEFRLFFEGPDKVQVRQAALLKQSKVQEVKTSRPT